jgi:hypothetical protein
MMQQNTITFQCPSANNTYFQDPGNQWYYILCGYDIVGAGTGNYNGSGGSTVASTYGQIVRIFIADLS